MKFSLLPIVCLMFIFSSCKKQPANNPFKTNNNTITAEVDGKTLTFNSETFAKIVTNEPGIYPYLLDVTGATDTSGSNAIITIGVLSMKPIVTGSVPSADTNPEPTTSSNITYSQNTAGSQLSTDYITNNFLINSTNVNVTSLSSTRVQGTFSGTLIYSLGDGTPTKTITNGKFDLAIN